MTRTPPVTNIGMGTVYNPKDWGAILKTVQSPPQQMVYNLDPNTAFGPLPQANYTGLFQEYGNLVNNMIKNSSPQAVPQFAPPQQQQQQQPSSTGYDPKYFNGNYDPTGYYGQTNTPTQNYFGGATASAGGQTGVRNPYTSAAQSVASGINSYFSPTQSTASGVYF